MTPAALEKARQAQALQAGFEAILALSREEFPPASRLFAPFPPPVDESAVRAAFRTEATTGLGMFERTRRRDALAQADVHAAAWIAAATAENQRLRESHQAALDDEWIALVEGQPGAVQAALAAALAGGPTRAGVVSAQGGEATLAVAVPPESAIPDRRPAVTDSGNLSLRKLTRTEVNAWYRSALAGHIVQTAKRAFAAVPGLQAVTVAAVRLDDAATDRTARPAVLMAVQVGRAALAAVPWFTVDAAEGLKRVAGSVLVTLTGAARTVAPLDLAASEVARLSTVLVQGPGAPRAALSAPRYQFAPPTGLLMPAPTGTGLRAATAAAVTPATAVPWGAQPPGAQPPDEPPGVAQPPKHSRRKKVLGGVAALLLLFVWVGQLGDSDEPDETADRLAVGADLEAASPKAAVVAFTVAGIEDGLIELRDPVGTTRDVRLEHLLVPAGADCLAGEAATTLALLLPVGAAVTMEDAGVITVDDVLVNAELARAGLAVVKPNSPATDAAHQAVVDAQEAARAAQAGLSTPPRSPARFPRRYRHMPVR